MDGSSVTLRIIGTPAPQGSKTAGVGRNGRAFVREGSSRTGRQAVADWRAAVIAEAVSTLKELGMPAPMAGPLRVSVTFMLPRPASKPKRVHWPHVKPDIDKLLRATLDALTQSGVFRDDAQVCQVEAGKYYAMDAPPGALVHVSLLEPAVRAEVPAVAAAASSDR